MTIPRRSGNGTDLRAHRQRLLDWVRGQLIGPAGSGRLAGSPLDRYPTGVLHPVDPDGWGVPGLDPAQLDGPMGAGLDASGPSGQPFASMDDGADDSSSDADGESDGEAARPLGRRRYVPPSSVAVSFQVRGDARVRVTASAARYRRVDRRDASGRFTPHRYERTVFEFGLAWPQGGGATPGGVERQESRGRYRDGDRLTATFRESAADARFRAWGGGTLGADRRTPPALRGRASPDRRLCELSTASGLGRRPRSGRMLPVRGARRVRGRGGGAGRVSAGGSRPADRGGAGERASVPRHAHLRDRPRRGGRLGPRAGSAAARLVRLHAGGGGARGDHARRGRRRRRARDARHRRGAVRGGSRPVRGLRGRLRRLGAATARRGGGGGGGRPRGGLPHVPQDGRREGTDAGRGGAVAPRCPRGPGVPARQPRDAGPDASARSRPRPSSRSPGLSVAAVPVGVLARRRRVDDRRTGRLPRCPRFDLVPHRRRQDRSLPGADRLSERLAAAAVRRCWGAVRRCSCGIRCGC